MDPAARAVVLVLLSVASGTVNAANAANGTASGRAGPRSSAGTAVVSATVSATAATSDPDEFPVVRLVGGQIRGQRVVSRTNTSQRFFSFRGVPYALPPEGPLRYQVPPGWFESLFRKDERFNLICCQAPRPALPWSGLRDATEDGNCCPQLANGNFAGSEDCLNLNVYTPLVSFDSNLSV